MADAAPEPDDTDLKAGVLTAEMLRMDVSLRPAPPPQTEPEGGLFAMLRPADSAAGKAADAEPMDHEEKADSEEAPKEESRPPATEEKEEAPAEPHAVSILKSGVVDGMAYTLYSDGSIEAELPQGTVRFASIAELRAYLDSAS
jgi:hypothetical protein